MILYEFTYTDGIGRTDEEREAGVRDFLLGEASMQGWASGYWWSLITAEKKEGFVRYYYRVEGEYLPPSELFDGVMESLEQAQQITRGEKP